MTITVAARTALALLFVCCHQKHTPPRDYVGTWVGGRSVLGETVELVIQGDGRVTYHRTTPDSRSDLVGTLDEDHMDVVFEEGLRPYRKHITSPSASDAGWKLALDGLELARR